jgi:hypothetical protein
MHLGAIACFLLASAFYACAWSRVAYGLAIFGVFFEIVAWVVLMAADKKQESNG